MKVDQGQLSIGSVVGLYRVVRSIDAGRSSELFEGQHMLLETKVALNVIGPRLALSPDLVERFVVEAKSASRIKHGNVAKVVDVGRRVDGYAYVVMELLEGATLAAALREAPLAWP